MFFYTKIRSYALATKIFKNTEDIGMWYIWCWCHTSFRHRQINVQNIAANVWHCGSCLSTYLTSCFGSPSHQIAFNVLRTILDVLRTFQWNLSPYGRNVMFFELFTEYISLRSTLWCSPNRPSVLTRATVALTASAFGICVKTLPLAGNEVRG